MAIFNRVCCIVSWCHLIEPGLSNEFQLAPDSAQAAAKLLGYFRIRVPLHAQQCDLAQSIVAQGLKKAPALIGNHRRERWSGLSTNNLLQTHFISFR
jgi:hypothetical protein